SFPLNTLDAGHHADPEAVAANAREETGSIAVIGVEGGDAELEPGTLVVLLLYQRTTEASQVLVSGVPEQICDA
ncbi:hypothetical protein PFISCL1PPCAC_4485, partial [Pristionchus fissidentatus]